MLKNLFVFAVCDFSRIFFVTMKLALSAIHQFYRTMAYSLLSRLLRWRPSEKSSLSLQLAINPSAIWAKHFPSLKNFAILLSCWTLTCFMWNVYFCNIFLQSDFYFGRVLEFAVQVVVFFKCREFPSFLNYEKWNLWRTLLHRGCKLTFIF